MTAGSVGRGGMRALTTDEVLAKVGKLLDECPDFSLDDALWCYAYEPRCKEARSLVNKAVGAADKGELIDWCAAHTAAEQRDHLAAAKERTQP